MRRYHFDFAVFISRCVGRVWARGRHGETGEDATD